MFLIGGVILILGNKLSFLKPASGEITLQVGQTKNLILADPAFKDTLKENLDVQITLESVAVKPHTPEFEIVVLKRNSAQDDKSIGNTTVPFNVIDVFTLEVMKIHQIEKTDIFFRLKEFYPDFQFEYAYPDRKDTIDARAPGITISLKTPEGSPVATLEAGDPSRFSLKDIVSLGAELEFYWQLDEESVRKMHMTDMLTDRIIFTGLEQKMYFLLDGKLEVQSFEENRFYTMPGQDIIGFTVLHCFPDKAYLKAVPSSASQEVNNPVAHLEIWRAGQSAMDAFVYPESRVRKGGDFAIPSTDYKIGIQPNALRSARFCDCRIRFSRDEYGRPDQIIFLEGEQKAAHGFHLRPVACNDQQVTFEVTGKTSPIPIMLALLFAGVALLVVFVKPSTGIE